MAAKFMSQINLMEQNHLCMFFCMGSDTLPPATHMNNSYLYGKEELGKYIVVSPDNNRKYKTDGIDRHDLQTTEKGHNLIIGCLIGIANEVHQDRPHQLHLRDIFHGLEKTFEAR